jgi:hypothetical protein
MTDGSVDNITFDFDRSRFKKHKGPMTNGNMKAMIIAQHTTGSPFIEVRVFP